MGEGMTCSIITVNLKVEIRRNSDGLISSQVWPQFEHYNDFWWEDGNASCDCNRELFFNRGLNLPSEELNAFKCSDGRFSVRLIDNDTQEILYSEF
jgi:hypothetical protein